MMTQRFDMNLVFHISEDGSKMLECYSNLLPAVLRGQVYLCFNEIRAEIVFVI